MAVVTVGSLRGLHKDNLKKIFHLHFIKYQQVGGLPAGMRYP